MVNTFNGEPYWFNASVALMRFSEVTDLLAERSKDQRALAAKVHAEHVTQTQRVAPWEEDRSPRFAFENGTKDTRNSIVNSILSEIRRARRHPRLRVLTCCSLEDVLDETNDPKDALEPEPARKDKNLHLLAAGISRKQMLSPC